MDINVTLFVQIINFLVCYWFLSRRFFNKVINVVEERIEKERGLLNSIEEIAGNINILNVKKSDDLSVFRKSAEMENLSIPSDYLNANEVKVDFACRAPIKVSLKEKVVDFIVEKCSSV
jgi:hypothetical protein